MEQSKYFDLSSLFLRLGIGGVFVTFGLHKLPYPEEWVIFIPNWLPEIIHKIDGLTFYRFLWIQGTLECVLGLHLLAGFLTRTVAFLCIILLGGIVWILGFDLTGIRDLGLLLCAFSLFVAGPGTWSVDAWLRSQEKG